MHTNTLHRFSCCEQFVRELRETLITRFQTFETEGSFVRTSWDYEKGSGGGEIALLRGYRLEKAAVNFSSIRGNSFPGDDASGPFSATGISLIAHPRSPHLPTAHFNLRYITTAEESWFGGGYDLTPMGVYYHEDRDSFHSTAKQTLDNFDSSLYPHFSSWAARYFFIPHRNRERGVGGLFFDHYSTGNFDNDMRLWQAIGNSFLDALMPIWERRPQNYTDQERTEQLKLRAHYVEYNLLYDRGTKFGFLSGGNPEAILCSMPPLAQW